METRMERYAKYRDQIRRMPPEQFQSKKVAKSDLDAAKDAVAPELSITDGGNGKTGRNSAPYSLYLKRRKRWLVVKIVALVLAVGAFVLWWFLLQGRR